MGFVKGKWKKKLIFLKAASSKSKSRSMDENNVGEEKKGEIIRAPNGCFSVYVGPQRQRFVVKTEFANHPLFVMLLEEAEMEYGFGRDGPICLPCKVDLFYKVLAEMDSCGDDLEQDTRRTSSFANKAKGYSNNFLVLLSPTRFRRHANRDSSDSGSSSSSGHGAYRIMDSEILKINHF